MCKLELTRGQFALLDEEDYEKFKKYSWHCTNHGYAARRDADNIHHYLHRDVLDAKKGDVIDHINGNKLDNRRENLRFCTQMQNSWNARHKRGRVPFTGVHISDPYAKQGWFLKKRYAAKIKIDGKDIWLGRYETPELAHLAYRDACIKYRGDFARLE